ncbi:hypothetical protein DL96DRAFT_1714121 [Flagelloscypha sp. PMI_526]|nr:hypothetical protein DL96DRAFT_1714121 [Flagelloscypha sp. PMI_526]
MRLVAPDTGQIPKDFVVYLGGHWATRLWGLWQFWFFLRGHYIVAHVPGSLFDRFDVSGPHDDPAAFERVARASDWGVELVMPGLRGVVPGKTKHILYNEQTRRWVHLRDNDRISTSHLPKSLTSLPLWRETVSIDEIHVIHHASESDPVRQIGLWRGMEVELLIGWDLESFRWINLWWSRLHTLHALGLEAEFTWPVLAHVFDADGFYVGLIREKVGGREPTFDDVSLLYATCTAALKHGIAFSGIQYQARVTDDNKIRFSDAHCRITNPADPDYQDVVDGVFNELSQFVQCLRQPTGLFAEDGNHPYFAFRRKSTFLILYLPETVPLPVRSPPEWWSDYHINYFYETLRRFSRGLHANDHHRKHRDKDHKSQGRTAVVSVTHHNSTTYNTPTWSQSSVDDRPLSSKQLSILVSSGRKKTPYCRIGESHNAQASRAVLQAPEW